MDENAVNEACVRIWEALTAAKIDLPFHCLSSIRIAIMFASESSEESARRSIEHLRRAIFAAMEDSGE